MKIANLSPFVGQHCETTATGTLIRHAGIDLSEAMLFGLGEGLGFIYWNMKSMPAPFLGGRSKPFALTESLAKNLNLNVVEHQTSSVKKAWTNVSEAIATGHPVGLQLDCWHLDYFPEQIHFAGHFAAIHGYDDSTVYMTDTEPLGSSVSTSLDNLAAARAEKGPMSAKNRSYTISIEEPRPDLPKAIVTAIRNVATTHLNPPIKNLGYKGIEKAGKEIRKLLRSEAVAPTEFATTAMLMEKAGTGGALFRNFYRDFLDEAHTITNNPAIKSAHQQFIPIAAGWTEAAGILKEASETGNPSHADSFAQLLANLSQQEYQTMTDLAQI